MMSEGNSGTKDFTFTVTRSGDTSGSSTVDFATADGTASGASDYLSNSGTLTFGAGDVSQTVTVQVKGDTAVEGNETFFVNLSNAGGATLADAQGRGTIVNDDAAAPPPKVSVSINNESAFEGNSGLRPITFKVTLDKASGKTVTVHYSTSNGTATAGSDYNAASGTVTFSPGQTSKTITVYIRGDKLKEKDEIFFVNLNSPVNAVLGNNRGTGIIRNDD